MLKQKRGNNKRKVIVSLSLVCLLFVAVITAVILINAFPNQAFESSIKVSYVAKDISAEVSAWYKEETGTKTYLTTTEGGTETVLELKANEDNTEKTLHMDKDITLTSSNKYVIFCYEFKNTGSKTFAGIHDFVNAIEGMNPTNMSITYSLDGTNYDTLNTGFSLSGHSEQAYYFKIEVTDLAHNANLDGSIIWDLGELKNNVTGTSNETDPVRIGQTTYSTFEEAYAAAKSGDVVTIKEDVTLSENFAVKDNVAIIAENKTSSGEVSASSTDAITITTPKTISFTGLQTFRLGSASGGVINFVSSNSNLAQFIYVGANAKLCLGKVKSSNYSGKFIYADSQSTLELNGVEISAFNSRVIDIAYNCNIIIKNSSFTNNANYVIHSESDVNIDNCTFENNQYSAVWGINIDASNSIFKNNASETYGGAIYYYRGESTISDCEFINNTATNDGGAIFIQKEAKLNIDNCIFTENEATSNGGAIHLMNLNSKLNVSSSTFTGNKSISGAGIYSAGEVVVDNSHFTLNETTGHASAIRAEKKSSISNSIFSNNNASANGTIFAFDELYVSGSTFTGNSALQGGAIYSQANLNIISTIFDGNTATAVNQALGGGAIRHTLGIFNIDNCEFTNNKTSETGGVWGGAINGSIDLCKNSSFTSNSAPEGGAVYGSSKFLNTTFTSNSAFIGGALYGSLIHLENCELVANSASKDGGAVAVEEKIDCINTNFIENTAEGYGGAIAKWTDDERSMEYNGCEFTKNTSAKDGGAIYSYKAICNITNSQFNENSAENGGALFIQFKDVVVEGVRYTTENFEERSAIIENNCTFTSNTTTKDGGAIYFVGGISAIKNSTIKNTTTGGNGAIYNAYSSIEVLSSEISNNTAGDGAGICGYNNSTIAIKDGAKINNNTASVRGGGIRILSTSTLLMKGGEISNNVVSKSGALSMTYGGGVCVSSGCTMEMTGGTIHLNKAINSTYKLGGNVFIDSDDTDSSPAVPQAVFNMSGGTISGDGTTQQATIGGGVAVFGEFNMTGGTISKCYAEIGGGVLNVGTSTITGGSILECVASNKASNNGKAIANNGTLNLGNVTLGSGQDLAMGYQKVTIGASVFPEGSGTLNVVENLTSTYTITFAQVTGLTPTISTGTQAIKKFTDGNVFATYLNGATADAGDFTTSGYTFYVSDGNVYMQAA